MKYLRLQKQNTLFIIINSELKCLKFRVAGCSFYVAGLKIHF